MAKRNQPVTINCAHCNKPKKIAPSRLRNNNFCNNICKGLHKRNQVVINCAYCNKPKKIQLKNLRGNNFCNKICSGKYFSGENSPHYKPKIKVNCSYCGKEKELKPSQFNENGNYCNSECLRKSKISSVKVNCAYCGKEKTITLSIYKKNKNHFCNGRCQGDYKNKKIKINCAYCGKEKEIKISRFNESGNYCNSKCNGAHLKGDKNSRWNRVMINCAYCGEKKEIPKCNLRENNFCNSVCQGKWRRDNWKDGKSPCCKNLNGLSCYDTYYHKISYAEECRRNPTNNDILQVRCTYCNNWYSPKDGHMRGRISALNSNCKGERRFYCGDSCKESCDIYGQKTYPKGFKQATSREVQADLRKLVLTRDQWTCIRCQAGVEKELHCHHLEGVELNPVLSADLDMCVTLCRDCHRAAHSEKNCGYNDFKRKPC